MISMEDTRVVQCNLRTPTVNGGHTHTVGWVRYRADLRVGRYVTLDDDKVGRRWEVLSMSRPVERDTINRGWHVGGL